MPPRAPTTRSRRLPDVIRLNVGGLRVEVSRRSLLEREPGSMLASLVRYHERNKGRGGDEEGNTEKDDDGGRGILGVTRDDSGALFLDGDCELFRKFVLPYLRFGEKAPLPCDSDDRARLALEVDYLQLSGLSAMLAAPPPRCCPWLPPPLSLPSSSADAGGGGASSLRLPADEARARAAAAGPECALDEALCESGGRLLSALELVLSLARGWILASAPGGGGGGEAGAGGLAGDRSISASAATTTRPPPIVCCLRGRGICHVARPGCFDGFIEEGVVSCGGPGGALSGASAAASSSAASSSPPSLLAPSTSNAHGLLSRLTSTVEREITESGNNAVTSPTQRTISSFSSLSSSSSSVAAATATAAEATALKPSTSDAAALQHNSHHAHPHGPRTSYYFSRELEPLLDAPIMIGGGYDKATYCPPASSSSSSNSSEGGEGENGVDWEKCSPAEKNRIVYTALSSTPLESPTEGAIKESILALAERPALVRSLLVRRFGFAEGTTVRASLETKISWRPSKTYCSADLFEIVQATCVIDLSMP